ncbi:MAG: hypothetical protein CMJ59_10755 [Planctomycetaceae bacterium]|nr:hypothetical protein [Planctomycetaceae bacterium]
MFRPLTKKSGCLVCAIHVQRQKDFDGERPRAKIPIHGEPGQWPSAGFTLRGVSRKPQGKMFKNMLTAKVNPGFGYVRLIVGALCLLAMVSFGLWRMPPAFAGQERPFTSCVYAAAGEKSFYEPGETVETLLKIMTLKKTAEYRVRFEATDESGNKIARQEKDLQLKAGLNAIPFLMDTKKTSAGDYKIQAQVYRGAKIVEQNVISVTVLDREYLKAKLARMERMRAGLRSILDRAARQGIDIAYPQTSWALSRLFERLIGTELGTAKREYYKLNWQMNYVLASIEKSIAQTREWMKHPARQLRVPQQGTSGLRIVNGALDDGHGPVLLLGSLGNFGRSFPLSDFRLYSALGFNSTEALLEFGPRDTQPVKGKGFSKTWLQELDAYMKAAAANNLFVYPTVEHCYIAPWMFADHPSAFTCGSHYLAACIANPQTKKMWADWLQEMARVMKDYPNLLGYCLGNEPHYSFTGYCNLCRRAFGEFLEREYSGIDGLNRLWGTDYKTFQDVQIPPQGRTDWWPKNNVPDDMRIVRPEHPGPINKASMYDWQRFNQHRMTEFFISMKEAVREIDRERPVFWESPLVCATWGEFGHDDGIDREEIGRLSDINGYDGWTSNFPGGDWAMDADVANLELMRDLSPGKPLFNSEWHTITSINGKVRYQETVTEKRPPGYIRAALWLGYLHGNSAGTLWAWGYGAPPPSGGRWQMLDVPYFVEISGRTALDLRRLAPEVIAFHRARRDVAIMFSMASKLQHEAHFEELRKFESLGHVPEELKSKTSSTSSLSMRQLKHVHFGLFCLDMNYGFISERQIAKGKLRGRKLLIVPAADFVVDETVNRLKEYLESGGTALLIGDSLGHDQRGGKRDVSGLFSEGEDLVVAGFPVKRSRFGKGRIYRTACLSGQEYRRFFESFLDLTGIQRSYRVTDMAGDPVDGIDFRTTRSAGRRLAYLVNLSRKKTKIKLTQIESSPRSASIGQRAEKAVNQAHDLIPNKRVTFPLEIEPLDVMLMEIGD